MMLYYFLKKNKKILIFLIILNMNKYDTNLYSRQIGTYGIDTMKKILNMKILILGLRGLGIEIAKNIILSGTKKVTIFDDNICLINDLSSNFYINENDININRRDKSCLNKLCELNPYVEVSIIENKNDIKEKILEHDILIITELINKEILYEYNNICRENKKGFIYSCSLGLCGFIFNDFGDEHFIYNKEGKEEQSFYIKNICKKDNKYLVTIEENEDENLYKTSSDYFSFKNINGMDKLNNENYVKIKIKSSNSFFIENTNDYGEYISGGNIYEKFIPEKIKFNSFKESLFNPFTKESKGKTLNIKNNNKEQFHITIIALHNYYILHNKLPDLNNENDINETIKLIKMLIEIGKEKDWIKKIKENELDINYISKIIKWSKSQISPICTFLGGIVTQEIIKFTGKYIPIKQWFHFDFFEVNNNLNNNEIKLLNSRYDDQISIFGNEIFNKLNNMNLFMIGAGALGCEFIKIFSLMGISKNKNKNITITDNDNIELSNLNRQFLFRNKDIQKSKSEIACKVSKELNKDINFKSYNYKVDKETENIFNDEFWENQNLIISAVDNKNARLYIDNQCTFYKLPFFESGTLGTSASSTIILPNETICYNDLPIVKKKEIPLCTLKSFPSNIEHCVEWGKIFFEELFYLNIQNLIFLISNNEEFFKMIFNNINKEIILEQLNDVNDLFQIYINKNYDDVIKYSVNKFDLFFNENIKSLLIEHPKDCIDKDGLLFWNHSRKIPHSIIYDSNDEICFTFIKSMINIYTRILKIKINNINDNYIKNKSNEYLNELKNKKELNNENIDEKINKLKTNIINNLSKVNNSENIIPETFEKDNEENSHIDLIYSMSILRARNYNIEENNKEKIKQIITNIVPAIISSTSSIAGFVSLQIYSLLQSNDRKNFKNLSFELINNYYSISYPEEVNKSKDIEATSNSLGLKNIPSNFTIWDNIEIKGPLNVKDFIDLIEKKYDFNINFINSDNICLFDVLLSEDDDEDYLKNIEDLYYEKHKINYKKKYIKIKIVGIQGKFSVQMPIIKYIV